MSTLRCWLDMPLRCQFSLANLPFGIISTEGDHAPRPAVAIGDYALDLRAFSKGNGFSQFSELDEKHIPVFSLPTLNAFASLGRSLHQATRLYLQCILRDDTPYPHMLRENHRLRREALIPLTAIRNHLPLEIGDYTDFFAGRNHAFNVGTLFRGSSNALNPNYYHIPVAYHGRASSVVVSGTDIRRPKGQIIDPQADSKSPRFSQSQRLDIELELGLFISQGNNLGRPIRLDDAETHIFGYVLMNDWSARDIQMWEYVPLGPFNAKNFGTSISPWVVLADALQPFMVAGLLNDTQLQDYLKDSKKQTALDITLEIELISGKGGSGTTIAKTNSKNLIWSWPQMIAHHTIGGCNLRTGDLFGSGTISGPDPGTYGSLLEHTQGGKVPLILSNGERRRFLEDDDTIVIKGWAGSEENGIGFGECRGTVKPPIS